MNTIDSVSLLAQAAYDKINNQPKVSSQEMNDAVDFQKMVNVEFNRYSKMSPDQILSYIKNVQSSFNSVHTSSIVGGNGIASSVIGGLKKSVDTNERMIRKSLLNEASVLDIAMAADEAKNIIQTIVTVRDKLFEAMDKVLSMQV